jgi:hypothetical protein
MESATVADKRLSMPPSNAKERDAGKTAATKSNDIGGRLGTGRVCGMPPKREPIVATGM